MLAIRQQFPHRLIPPIQCFFFQQRSIAPHPAQIGVAPARQVIDLSPPMQDIVLCDASTGYAPLMREQDQLIIAEIRPRLPSLEIRAIEGNR